MKRIIVYFAVFLSLIARFALPEDWPQFRGLNAAGWTDTASLPDRWDVSTKENVRWVLPIEGVGHSSPVVAGKRIFLTTAVGNTKDWRDDSVKHSWKIYAIDAENGKILWEQTAHEGLPRAKRHSKASQSNSTPASDGKFVAAIFGSEGLFVYSIDGKLLWKKDLGLLDPGLANDPTSQWGHASSPIIHGNHVIVQCDKHTGSFLAAYDLATGKEAWKTNRADELPSWSTPAIYQGKETTEIITNGQFFRGYDARTGKELWRFADAAEVKQPTPVISEDIIYFSGGYPRGRPITALRAGARGDISAKSKEWVLWKTEHGSPYTPTPILYRGHLYAVENNGVLTCYDFKTGEQKYETKLQGDFSASPVANNGKLFFASEGGEISIVNAGPVFQLLTQIDMGSPCFATPAISDQTLFIRTLNELYAIGK
jgi:outer membrane protein assembly factor BamB